jgi:hypothetical protein
VHISKPLCVKWIVSPIAILNSYRPFPLLLHPNGMGYLLIESREAGRRTLGRFGPWLNRDGHILSDTPGLKPSLAHPPCSQQVPNPRARGLV